MSNSIIIIICVLLLLAYLFDISSSKTRIPSPVLLLILGWLVHEISYFFSISLPDLEPILPIFGTLGLILIVLEGSLELQLDKSKLHVIKKASLISLLQLLLLSFGIAYFFIEFHSANPKLAFLNALPLAIISSAIAIPSARLLSQNECEFITYESSLSDIYGVILFNIVLLNDELSFSTYAIFFLQLASMIVVSFLSTIGLIFLLNRITHHIKFIPVILLIILIYSVSKIFHMPSLIFILLFGLFIGNFKLIPSPKILTHLRPEILTIEIEKFKVINAELTFLIRSLFFLLFGYSISIMELINQETALWSFIITVFIYGVRFLSLKLFQSNYKTILFFAPRGLITILLFLSIPIEQKVPVANKSLIIQVIILTAVLMMAGMLHPKPKDTTDQGQ